MAINQKIDLPHSVIPLFEKTKHSVAMQPSFKDLKEWLLELK
jgi:hypothetical protein